VTVRLSIDEGAWRSHIQSVVATVDGLVPVVKGNGYGFGRTMLFREAASFAGEVAVGSVAEAVSVGRADVQPEALTVLTPSLRVPPALPSTAVLTVGSKEHVHALRDGGWRGRVHIKLRSSMHRYGVEPGHLAELMNDVELAGLTPFGFMFHPPLLEGVRAESDTIAEIDAWIPHLDPRLPISVSHIGIPAHRALRARHPQRTIRLRLGTALWHGNKSFLHLTTDVIDRLTVGPETRAGYRLIRVVDGGTIVLVGAGSSHGVAPLADGRSPFHHHRQRLTMLEAPHMHTSMLIVGRNQIPPEIGEWLDLQRPLITTQADEIIWT
jgi:Alanine racemase, N-terminal domain